MHIEGYWYSIKNMGVTEKNLQPLLEYIDNSFLHKYCMTNRAICHAQPLQIPAPTLSEKSLPS